MSRDKFRIGTAVLRILDALGYFPRSTQRCSDHLSYCVHMVGVLAGLHLSVFPSKSLNLHFIENPFTVYPYGAPL